ncbi:MAG: 30S ribosomal protein S7 [Candidatus Niyogibacteria bacterium]|nr:30S ribosomal protein S7 [Candidatus Niyogibacteria bacterium]
MRRKANYKRELLPDPIYNSEVVAKFINGVMQEGKKNTARKAVYAALEAIKKMEKTENPLAIFEEALRNVGPALEVRSRRVGGANYQVPHEVRPERKQTLAFRWILAAARARKGMPMSKRLATELIEASKNQGAAVKKREDTHRMAEANRAFAHFAW